jgi:hypothetical protein
LSVSSFMPVWTKPLKKSARRSGLRCGSVSNEESSRGRGDSSLRGGASRGTGRGKRRAATPTQNDASGLLAAGTDRFARPCTVTRKADPSLRFGMTTLEGCAFRAPPLRTAQRWGAPARPNRLFT